jgi:hypothetical protein
VISRIWPPSGRGWALVAFCALVFLALDVLALAGFDFAVELLVFLVAGLAGAGLAFVAAYPLRRRARSGSAWMLFGFLAGLASTFGLVYLGAALFGIPAFPTAESGHAGTFVYGFAMLFGLTFASRFGPGRVPARDEASAGDLGANRARIGVLAVVVGAVAGLFALTFLASVVLEYVVFPLARLLG